MKHDPCELVIRISENLKNIETSQAENTRDIKTSEKELWGIKLQMAKWAGYGTVLASAVMELLKYLVAK